jgi:hypothetical protein
MAVSAANVLVGAPDQATTGAILSAPIGTALPTTATTAINIAFTDSGYVSDKGLQLSPKRNTNGINDWSGAEIRKILQSFAGELKWEHLEINLASLKNSFGDDNVTATAKNLAHGNQLAVKMGAYELPRKSWVFKIKDGDTRILVVVPDGQVTETGELSFVKSDAIKLPVTLSCYPDATGNSVYLYTDDGDES